MTEKAHTTNPSTEIGEFFRERNLRAFQVRGDRISSTLKDRDWALVVPIDGYVGEGIYLAGIEHLALYRVQSIGSGDLRLSSDNNHKVPWKVEQLDRSLS